MCRLVVGFYYERNNIIRDSPVAKNQLFLVIIANKYWHPAQFILRQLVLSSKQALHFLSLNAKQAQHFDFAEVCSILLGCIWDVRKYK